ncbi:PKD domain-containing protein [Nocardioides sp. 1609]|uniref:PKD domain-containing protein n=1 Tax=Nocardioides sp. 1609 TaxID=2508327 RepID=UPI0014313D31|nr:PKD domain-containing protein [Nocardioides sp. 1609]
MARPTTRLKRRARRLSRWSALRVRILVALVVAAGLSSAVMSQAAATPAHAPAALPQTSSATTPPSIAPRTWIIDAREDAPMPDGGTPMQGWVIRETGLNNAHHPLTITVGDTVEWHFESVNQYHDLLNQNTLATWMPPLTGGGGVGDPAVSYTFTAPGTYNYICNNHQPLMSGQIIVQDAGPGDTNQPPTADPMASPTSGAAPLLVSFMAHGHDADGDVLTYLWDFGTDAGAADQSTLPEPQHTYTAAGTYTATVTVTDAQGASAEESLQIAVTGDGGGGDGPVLEVVASATPAAGTAPVAVTFGAAVALDPDATDAGLTTTGQIRSFADGLATYPDITGSAEMVRTSTQTTTTIALTGLEPGAPHNVHVHEQTCASANAGAHYRFDTTLPFAETNEIWLPFTSNASGASGPSGTVAVTSTRRAGTKAVSIVIHDPDNPTLRIACVDLAPALTWDFGDGSTGSGPRPTHTYRAAGTYTATVTARASATVSATASVGVVVRAGAAPQTTIVSGPQGHVRAKELLFRFGSNEPGSTFECRLDAGAWKLCGATTSYTGLKEGRRTLRVRATDSAGSTDASPAVRQWVVDRTGPTVRAAKPTGATRDRTPTIRARVGDRLSPAADLDVVLRVDGLRAPARLAGGAVTYTPRRALAPGRHVVRLVAVDLAGNRTVRVWRFTVRR